MTAQNLVKVSDKADEALGSFDFAAHGGRNTVRLFVQGFGWGGPSIGMALDEPKEEDMVIDRGSYKLVLDSQMEGIIRQSGGLQIDFVDEADRRGYMVKLASAGGDCGSCSC